MAGSMRRYTWSYSCLAFLINLTEISWFHFYQENLRRRVRDALSRRRMVAFLIVDSPHESIIDVQVHLSPFVLSFVIFQLTHLTFISCHQSVSFLNGSPTFSKYLDTFPFPYYIILSNIEALPRTLSGLLRQVTAFFTGTKFLFMICKSEDWAYGDAHTHTHTHKEEICLHHQ